MKTKLLVTMVLSMLVASVAMAEAACAAKCPKAAAGEKEGADEGWITLFDGTSLDGWQNARRPDGETKWAIEEGAMTNVGKAPNIATKEEYKDFALSLEYKIVAHGNSGVYLRGRVEIQILDSAGKTEMGAGDDGAIYDQFPPAVNASKPAGEWNTLEACYVGDTVCAKLNGQVIQDKTKISQVTGGALPGAVDAAGPLMLQGDHGKIWFRNVKIKPLAADACATGASCCPASK
ncbi:MAG: hypothetical protein QG656_2666 [Candidatus Hydrogenedentes bacterium]|nr:hypothetical protein [Candidatus Hydrogenedentota bacterium]